MKWKLRKLFELVKNKGKSLAEVYALIPGSQELYEQQIRKALRDNPPSEFGAHSYSWLEACLGPAPDTIHVEVSKPDGYCYFEVQVSVNEAGDIEFGTATEVEYTLMVQSKTESQRFQESLLSQSTTHRTFNEQLATQYRLNESEGTTYLSVDFAGQADVRNRNGRIYTQECLEEAVTELQVRLPLPFCTVHEDQTDLSKVAGLIHEVSFDSEKGTVTIPKIELLETAPGKSLKELLDKGVSVEISHRAVGQGYLETDESTGQETEVVTWLRYEGFDTVWPGRSGFGNTFLEPKPEGGPPPTPPGAPQPAGTQLTETRVAEIVGQAMSTALSPFQTQFQEQLDEQKKQQQKQSLRVVAAETIEEVLLTYPQFGDVEKNELRRIALDVNRIYERVSSNPSDRASIKAAQERLIEGQVETFSKMHAAYKLDAQRLPEGRNGSRYINKYGGVTNVDEVIGQSPLEVAEVNRVVETVLDAVFPNELLRKQAEVSQKHENFKIHAKMLDRNMHQLAPKIQREVDRGLKWETLQGDIDVPVSITSMYIELAVWRMLTAIPHVQLHPMVALLENIPIQDFVSAFGKTAGLDKWARASGVAEGAERPTSKVAYGNYLLGASSQKYATTYTQESLATVRGTVMDITTEVVALCAKDIADAIDGMLWELMVNESLAGKSKKVSTAETLTYEGTKSAATVWTAAHAGWVTYEWVVSKNSDGNPTKSYPQRLFPDYGETDQSASGLTRQVMAVTDTNSSPQKYDYARRLDGTIDETKHWYFDGADGTITLTSAGRNRLANADSLKLTYQYSENCSVWDANTPTGMGFKDHLWDLRFAISDARQRVVDENYTPTTLAWSFAAEDKIAGGENFRRDGLTTTDVVDAQNTVTNFSGMLPVWSANFPKKYALVFQDKHALYGIHTPYMMGMPQMIDRTGDPFLSGTQFSGAAVPKWQKGSVVALQNFPYAE